MAVEEDQVGVWLNITGPRSILAEDFVVQTDVNQTWNELFRGMGHDFPNSVRVATMGYRRGSSGSNAHNCARLSGRICDFVANCRIRGQCYRVRLFDSRERRGRRNPRASRTSARNATAAVGRRTRRRTVGTRNGGPTQPRQPTNVQNQPERIRNGQNPTGRAQGAQRPNPTAEMLQLMQQNREQHENAAALHTEARRNLANVPLPMITHVYQEFQALLDNEIWPMMIDLAPHSTWLLEQMFT